MAVGKQASLDAEQKRRIEAAVQNAESKTGLEFLVYLGSAGKNTRKDAERLLKKMGYATLPGVVILVALNQHRVEVATSPSAVERLPDETCQRAVDVMVPAFRQGDWIAGLELGLSSLADEAGAGQDHGGEELPDFLQ